MIHVQCPTCVSPLEFADDLAGTKVFCPHCKQKLLLPVPDSRSKTILAPMVDTQPPRMGILVTDKPPPPPPPLPKLDDNPFKNLSASDDDQPLPDGIIIKKSNRQLREDETDDEEDDDRPRKKKRHDDEEDDDRPRRKKRRNDDDRERRPRRERDYLESHHGPLVLMFSIMGIFFIPLAAIAWWMGGADLKKMADGRMDPDGQGITSIGYAIGMIVSVLYLLGVGLLFLFCCGGLSALSTPR
jgi:hypothetical protein